MSDNINRDEDLIRELTSIPYAKKFANHKWAISHMVYQSIGAYTAWIKEYNETTMTKRKREMLLSQIKSTEDELREILKQGGDACRARKRRAWRATYSRRMNISKDKYFYKWGE